MRCIVQRALDASCVIDNKTVGKIDKGLMVLVGFTEGDDLDKIKKYVNVIRLNFTNESYDETVRIITDYKDKLDGSKEKKFDSKNQTHGHFKRPII